MMRAPALVSLLLALLLPLQAFAWVSGCEAPPAAHAAEHCAGHDHEAPAGHAHHPCGACCCMAVAPLPTLLGLGRTALELEPRPVSGVYPARLPDRLDRPPRT